MTDPNRFAGPAEAALLRRDIAEDSAVLIAVAKRVASSEATLHVAERAFQDAKEQLETAQQACAAHRSDYASKAERLHMMRGRLHPIRRLPAEVLGEIFEEYLAAEATVHPDGSDEQWHHLYLAPNIVAQVSRHWRRVACNTLRLWRFISVEFRPRVESMTDGEWISALAARIARSGTAPARLLIRGPFPDYDANFTDELPGYEPAEWMGPKHIWEPLIALAPRCQAIRIVIVSTQVYFGRIGPLLSNDAPALEELSICLCPPEDILGLSSDSDSPSPDFYLNLKAPKLRRVALQGVRPRILNGPAVFQYPGVTHADISINNDFSQEHVRGLLRRLPSLSHITLSYFVMPGGVSLDWFAHPGVRRLSFDCPISWLQAGGANPQTFPALASVYIAWSGALPILSTGFAATGPFHATRRLSLGVHFLDDKLVRALDLLPRLESALLRGQIIASSFVWEETWMRSPGGSGNWRCPALQELTLTSVKEIEFVGPEEIVTWLSLRNSTSGPETHSPIRALQVECGSLTWSKVQVNDFADEIKRLLAK